MQQAVAGEPDIEVKPLKTKYPQGGEKQLVEAVTGRQVPMPPAIPINVGAVVQNVATSFAVYEAVMKHKPLFERYVTVTGKRVEKPGNFVVRMGTSAADILDLCGGLPACDWKPLLLKEQTVLPFCQTMRLVVRSRRLVFVVPNVLLRVRWVLSHIFLQHSPRFIIGNVLRMRTYLLV